MEREDGKREREREGERGQGRRADKSNANSYLLLCKDAADGRAWPGLISKWKVGPSLAPPRDSETRASGCHAHREMMLSVLPSRKRHLPMSFWRRAMKRDGPGRP